MERRRAQRYGLPMSQAVLVEIQVPDDLERFRLPSALDLRLQSLLDKQDGGTALDSAERAEAEAWVGLSETLSLLRLRAEAAAKAP